MSVRKTSDQGFDDFRKERQRARAKAGPTQSVLGYENQALRELEQVEANEMRDRQLTREVHDFFAAATRQAASIVDRVAKDAQQETGAKVEQEMEAFLIDSLARMNNFVLAVLQSRRGTVAEAQMTPSLGNLAGAKLDEFRWEGTAEVEDKHIGQDPFATTVDEVQREFRLTIGEGGAPNDLAVPIDQHLVAAVRGPNAPAAGDATADDERTAAAVAAASCRRRASRRRRKRTPRPRPARPRPMRSPRPRISSASKAR
jgi:hypothetical protein